MLPFERGRRDMAAIEAIRGHPAREWPLAWP